MATLEFVRAQETVGKGKFLNFTIIFKSNPFNLINRPRRSRSRDSRERDSRRRDKHRHRSRSRERRDYYEDTRSYHRSRH